MKKITNLIISTRTTAIMLILYAVAMAWATIVENDHGTPTAKALIYNAKWFEFIMLILILNFIGNIYRYKLWSLKKWPVLLFHVSFIFLFIGGTITRYISYEGTMHIREGEMSNIIVSEGSFFKAQITDEKGRSRAYQEIPFTLTSKNIPTLLKPFQRQFKTEYEYFNKKVKVKVTNYVPRAQSSLKNNPNGKKYLHIVIPNGKDNGESIYIEEGSAKRVDNSIVSYNSPVQDAINITIKGNEKIISSPMMGRYVKMNLNDKQNKSTGAGEVLIEGENKLQPLTESAMYQFPNVTFVLTGDLIQTGEVIYSEGDLKENSFDPDLISMTISTDKESKNTSFFVRKDQTELQQSVQIDGLLISIGYGAKLYHTEYKGEPFYIKLNKFIIEHYPGSTSPSSYESEVSVVDEGKESPYKIYMNHILNYKGYRFFQASFDQDLKGTILSVNHDFWGTTITYIGYALLIIGMFFTLFWKGTHFWNLNDQLKKIAKNKKSYSIIFLFFSLFLFSQEIKENNTSVETHVHEDGTVHSGSHEEKIPEGYHKHEDGTLHKDGEHEGEIVQPSAKNAHNHPSQPQQTVFKDGKSFAESIKIPKEQSDKFGALLVQSFDGRIKPVNTLALEILRKLYKKDKFYNLDANQFMMSISLDPISWANIPLIKIGNKGGEKLKNQTKANEEGYTTLMDLFPSDANGNPYFILEKEYLDAFAKKPALQSNYDKEIIELNDKVQVMQGLITAQYLKFVPIENDANNTWSSIYISESTLNNTAVKLIGSYFSAIMKAEQSGDWATVNVELQKLIDYQHKWGGKVIPSQSKIDWEIKYNNWDIFLKIMILYSIVGTILLLIAFIKLFLDKNKIISIAEYSLLGIIIIGALIHGAGLGIRWYISGHEPWSNGYEAIMFISWISVLSGFLLYKNRNGFIPAAGCFVAVILMGFAHGGDQMNPQITPLVPVLKSYWLMIHVGIITSSYGFLGLSAVIGAVVLILFIINNKKISQKVDDSIKELTIVNEISLTIGIFLLTIGTFLGGIWANESWGRYWSWDPKETWAWISVIVYAVVLHLRLVPGLRGKYIFNLTSLLSFSTIIMTYFGVNYYLSGLHSYAQGDPVPVPTWVYIVIGIVILLAIAAYIAHNRKFDKQK